MTDGKPDTPLDAIWRAQAASAQEAVLPGGRVAVSASAPFGVGGLGRHLKEIIDALDRRRQPRVCICESTDAGSGPSANRGLSALTSALAPLARFSPAWRMWAASVEFDVNAARRLSPADHLIAFNGTSVAQFRAARKARWESIALVSATSHIRRVVRQQARAHRQYPLERPWATRLIKRNLIEYAQADRIYVASRYVFESFIEEGIPEELLSVFPLTPDARYQPNGEPRSSHTFDIVYVGSLTVDKGVPLLLDAVRRLPYTDIRLVLVGGWTTRGMRRFIQGASAQDARINVCLGDPLPHLRDARLYVQPTYNDGFGYAAAEALACGLPVIASEDTGMKDLIDPDRNGLILPTGDLQALTEAIEAAYRAEILVG